MADVDEETIEEIFNAELERLQAAMEELMKLLPEEPETIGDAFEIATSETETSVAEVSPMDSLLLSTTPLKRPPGPPAAPSMDALPPGPPSPTGPPQGRKTNLHLLHHPVRSVDLLVPPGPHLL